MNNSERFQKKFDPIVDENIQQFEISDVDLEFGISIVLRYPNTLYPKVKFGKQNLMSLIRLFVEKTDSPLKSLSRLEATVDFFESVSGDFDCYSYVLSANVDKCTLRLCFIA